MKLLLRYAYFSLGNNTSHKIAPHNVFDIFSLNVMGLRDGAKKREIFNWLREKKASICMLQEVHCIDETNHLWRAKWGYETVFTSYESNKAGVCFLFNNNFNFEFQRVYTDPARRFIICDIKVNEKFLTLANMYAPNEDNPSFFQSFLDHFVDFKCEDIIISGDFNLVLDQNSSKKS